MSRRAFGPSVLCLAGLALSPVAAAADVLAVEQTVITISHSAFGLRPERESATRRVQVADQQQADIAQLIKKAEEQGHVRVIVGLKLPDGFTPEGELPSVDAVERQRSDITAARQALMDSLQGYEAAAYASWDSLPHVALQASAAALKHLVDSPYVTTIQEDLPVGTTAPE